MDGPTADPETPVEPLGPPLPKHAYIFIEEGECERSGERAWLAMAGRQVQRTFHGPEARRLARDWVAAKFGTLPYDEVEVLLLEEEIAHGNAG